MKAGLPISLLLHGAFFVGFAWMGGKAKPLAEGNFIPVEIVTVKDVTNVRASLKGDKTSSDEPMSLINPMENAQNEDDILKTTLDEADPVGDISDMADNTDAPTFDLDRISALVDKSKDTAPDKNQQQSLQGDADKYVFGDVSVSRIGEGTALTASELDALSTAIGKCWRMPADAQDPHKLVVRLRINMLLDGFVEDVKIIDKAAMRRNAPGNPFWDVVEQRALRAVPQCAPYKFLSNETYAQWRVVTVNVGLKS